MSSQHHTFICEGASITYQRGGSGAPILFLQGEDSLSGNAAFADMLRDGHDVLMPDHPGFGTSDTPTWFKTIGDVAYFYLDFLERLDLRGVHLVGASLGGWMAAEIALRSRERIASTTLIAPLGVRQPGLPVADMFMMSPADLLKARFADPALAEATMAEIMAGNDERGAALLKDRYATARLCWHPRFHNPELQRWLHRLSGPVHLVWGENDAIAPTGIATAWQDKLPHARLSVIRGAGHLPHIEHAVPTAEAIQSFIREVRS